MRLFITINFDEQTKQNIVSVQQQLKKFARGNFSHAENLHLTLAFLGEVHPNRVDDIKQAMNITEISPLTLTFDHVNFFKRNDGDLWWIGLAENKTLLDMQQKLCSHLSDAGFILENRRFSPHITLARKVRLHQNPNYDSLLDTCFKTDTDAISLMRSERINGKLTYTEQYRVIANAE